MALLSNAGKRAILSYVTDRSILRAAASSDVRETLLRRIAEAAEAGVDWIQIREKDLSTKDCATLTREALARVAGSPGVGRSRILVNDRLDVALAVQAGGVHLREESLPVKEARRLVELRASGEDFLIGVSCHTLQAAKSASEDRADYLIFGPVFATPSKAAFGAPQGLERLAEVCRWVKIPVLAIGGITVENTASCLAAGAAGIAAIRLFQEEGDLARLVQTLRQLKF